MPHVTFVTHDASRSGAPAVLLTLMRWLRANTELKVSTLSVIRGPLLEEFARLGPVRTLSEWPRFDRVRILLNLVAAPQTKVTSPRVRRATTNTLRWGGRKALDNFRGSDLIYANSVESAPGVYAIRDGEPLISHLHEGAYYLLDPTYEKAVRTTVRRANRIVASSHGVGSVLEDDLGIDPKAISVCYPFLDATQFVPDGDKASWRARLDLPQDAFIVGMCGGPSWRKGPDVIFPVARETLRRAT